jgi:hypothetical protein
MQTSSPSIDEKNLKKFIEAGVVREVSLIAQSEGGFLVHIAVGMTVYLLFSDRNKPRRFMSLDTAARLLRSIRIPKVTIDLTLFDYSREKRFKRGIKKI